MSRSANLLEYMRIRKKTGEAERKRSLTGVIGKTRTPTQTRRADPCKKDSLRDSWLKDQTKAYPLSEYFEGFQCYTRGLHFQASLSFESRIK